MSTHELVHVASIGVPMHPLLVEGLAVYMAGAQARVLRDLACEHRVSIRSWRDADLRSLLATGRNAARVKPDDETGAVLGGLLAAVLVEGSHPVQYLQLTPLMQASSVGGEIVAQWDAAIQRATAACVKP